MMSSKNRILVLVDGIALSPSSSLRTLILKQCRELNARELPLRQSVTGVRELPSDVPLRDEDSGQRGGEDDA